VRSVACVHTNAGFLNGGLKVQQIKQDLYVIEGTSNGSNDAGNIAIYVTQKDVVLVGFPRW
jgi:hypothetical protein